MSFGNVKAKSARLIVAAAVMIATAGVTLSCQAQTITRRRETSATRRARIQRTIADTYSHRWEVGGGGGYMRWRSGESLQRNNEVTFWFDTTYFLNPKLGIMGTIRGAYGDAKIGNNDFNLPFNPQVSEYAFMAGPEYRLVRHEKTGFSLFATGGSALGKFGGDTKGIDETRLGLWPSSNARPAFSLGGNLDYNFFPNLAVRVSPFYLGTNFGGTFQNSFGANFGLVYRFGRIH